MAFTNMSGANDTNLTNDPTQPNADALGEPVDIVEVVEVQTYEPTPSGYDASMGDAGGAADGFGFRWWMIPAVAVPVAAGATAAALLLRRRRQQVLLLRRRRQPAPVAAYKKVAKQSRDWMDMVRRNQATRTASKALSQGVVSVRGAAKSLPDTASSWRTSAGDLVGAAVATAAAKNLLDSATDFWNASAARAQRAARERGRGAYMAADAARASIVSRFAGGKAQDRMAPAKKVAKAKASKAAVQTRRAAKRAGKRANSAVKRTRAFTFGMLTAALVTYWRAWQQRLREKETRETAGGRMVKA